MKESGVYSRKQLLAMGYDADTVARALRTGDLIRLRHGWYATRLHDPTVAAAVRDGGVLTCVDALTFHGLWVPPGHRGLHLRRSEHLSGKNKACRLTVGAESVANQAVDPVPIALKYASACLTEEEWIAVADSYLNKTGADVGDLRAAMGRIGAEVRRWLGKTNPKSQSGTESISRIRLERVGFHVIVQPFVPDVGHPDLRIGKLLIECDSVQHHASREDYERDHHRDRRALVNGWMSLRLTYDDIVYDWDGTLADIRALVDRSRVRSEKDRLLIAESVRRTALEGL